MDLKAKAPPNRARSPRRSWSVLATTIRFIPPTQIVAFMEEMTRAKVDFQVIIYGGTKHSFTEPRASERDRWRAWNIAPRPMSDPGRQCSHSSAKSSLSLQFASVRSLSPSPPVLHRSLEKNLASQYPCPTIGGCPWPSQFKPVPNAFLPTTAPSKSALSECSGRIVYGEESFMCRDTVKLVLAEVNRVVINLEQVSYIDSGGIGTLLGLRLTSARNSGGDMEACVPLQTRQRSPARNPVGDRFSNPVFHGKGCNRVLRPESHCRQSVTLTLRCSAGPLAAMEMP